MIWKPKHISPGGKQGERFLMDYMEEQSHPHNSGNGAFRIAIVGGGPKGLYALEHLSRKIAETGSRTPVDVLWLNSTKDFGCGPNYQIQQPDYLLINYCIGNVDAWERVDLVAHKECLNLTDWITKFCPTPAAVRPTDFASRALVGRYLQYVTMQVIRSLPLHVNLYLLPASVTEIRPAGNNTLLVHTGGVEWLVDNVLLATGHCYENLPLIRCTEKNVADTYIGNAYPIGRLDSIPSGSPVGIVGLGLTFIDVALQLTEGRGGAFDTNGNYVKTGREPTLYPFSRNQLPILPRGPVYGAEKYRLHYLNDDWIHQINKIRRQRKINFMAEIYPMLQKEVRFAYYSKLLQTTDEQEVMQYIKSLPERGVFSLKDLLFPEVEQKETPQKTFIEYVERIIAEAEKGELESPLMAAAAVWREAVTPIGQWYRNGGFTGVSQRVLDNELLGAFCRTSFGPPVVNMKKILSLAKAGVIQLIFDSQVTLHSDGTAFMLSSNRKRQKVNYVIDARIARPNLIRSNSRLYKILHDHKLVTPLNNESYYAGCPEMDSNGRSLSEQAANLYFYGSNTEGFSLDNDSLSRTKNNLASSWAECTLQQMATAKHLSDECKQA